MRPYARRRHARFHCQGIDFHCRLSSGRAALTKVVRQSPSPETAYPRREDYLGKGPHGYVPCAAFKGRVRS